MMTTITLKPAWPKLKNRIMQIVLCIAPLVLFYLFREAQRLDPTMGLLDAGVWQLIALSALSFMGLSTLSWWLLQRAWVSLGLPKIEQMVSQFNELELWQQFALYWASFALLLLAAVMSLVAVF